MRRDILLTEVPCIIIQLGKSFSTHSLAFFLPTCTSVLGPSINPIVHCRALFNHRQYQRGGWDLSRTHQNPRYSEESSAKCSRILLYMHYFRIVSSVNSWVARLLCLPPIFRFVRLGAQRENHCNCASS